MLSPLDLQNKKVITKKKRYDKQEMDEYLELVFDNYKELFEKNQKLEKDVKTLSDGIHYYRSIETTLQQALVLAEKTAKETKDAAALKAEAIEKDANAKAEKIVSSAEQEYNNLKGKSIHLIQQFNQYKMQLKQVAAAQLELVTSDSFDVYSPELDALNMSQSSLPSSSGDLHQNTDSFIEPKKHPVKSETEHSFSDFEPQTLDKQSSTKPTEQSELEKTMIIPDLKKEIKNEHSRNDEEELSILTADTIDLSTSIEKVKEIENNIQKPVEAKTKDVQDAIVIEPVEVKSADPLDAALNDAHFKKPEILEPMEDDSQNAPTLDSLLQSINITNNKKKKKGQDEDPFEFLGSVDDF